MPAATGEGALTAAALTAEVLKARGLPLVGVIIGDWPADPGLAEQCNVEDLPRVGDVEVVGGLGRPRELDQPLQVGADDAVLGGR